ncbi:hypothetical protein F4677DRAFT_276153 [Hypoxylon crocopeplum]|nr:hypothetical protein F4677DRAFT_276153 [Hypoxylon crocopeplum]
MGFTTGFTGGLTLTLSIAYLTVLAHQRNREHQIATIRQQTRLLSGIVDPLPPTLPPTRAELAAAERANLVERAKDRWNAEVEGAVRWAQNKDWDEVREGVELSVARLWAKAFGDAREQAERGEVKAQDAMTQGKEKAGSVVAAANNALKTKSSEAATRTEEKASEAKSSIFGAIGKGFEKAKSAVVGVAEKETAEALPQTLSPQEKALRERYQGSGSMKQSTDEVLAARRKAVYEQVSRPVYSSYSGPNCSNRSVLYAV